MTHIRAVCFDGFGSLVDIATHRLESTDISCHRHRPTGRRAMRKVRNGPPIVDKGLEAQYAAAYMRPGADMLWATLRRIDIRIIVRLNRNAGLEQALLSLIPGIPDLYFSRFSMNSTGIICKRLNVSRKQILFITSDHAVARQQSVSPSITINNFENALYDPDSSTKSRRIPGIISALIEQLWDASEGDFHNKPALHSDFRPYRLPTLGEAAYHSSRLRENSEFNSPQFLRRQLRKWRLKRVGPRSMALLMIGRTIGRQYL